MNTLIDYSIVICTYNPDERILESCLKAVASLDREHITSEVILVDNNSSKPVLEISCVKHLGPQIPGFQILFEAQQGVKFARIAAINIARGNHVVYIDYDNDPDPDYLQELKKLNNQFPEVAAWGPGQVDVIFTEGIDSYLERYARNAFQQRKDMAIQYSKDKEWQPHYPFGTGLCTLTSLLRDYVELEKKGDLTLKGREGDSLTSGEDTQMILVCIRQGYAAGIAPQLKLRHLINGKKANHAYLMKLAYGTSSCYETCLLQIFPKRKQALEQQILPGNSFMRRVLKRYVQYKWTRDPIQALQLAQYIGVQAGVYLALGKPVPAMVQTIIKKLKLQ